MSKLTARFILKVANASITKARKKVPGLQWGRGMLLRRIFSLNNIAIGTESCALGIAELSACTKAEVISNKTDIAGLRSSRLGKIGANYPTSYYGTCPLETRYGNECFYMFNGEAVEVLITHINDHHATSWAHCKRLLRRMAKLELTTRANGTP